jgi:hypothetical protein
VSSNEHTVWHPREAGKKKMVMRGVLWLSVRHGSVLREEHCQTSARDGKVCEKKGAATCWKDAGTRSED